MKLHVHCHIYMLVTCLITHMITCLITQLFTAFYMNAYIVLQAFTWDECLCARAGHALAAAPAAPVAPAGPHGGGRAVACLWIRRRLALRLWGFCGFWLSHKRYLNFQKH